MQLNIELNNIGKSGTSNIWRISTVVEWIDMSNINIGQECEKTIEKLIGFNKTLKAISNILIMT